MNSGTKWKVKHPAACCGCGHSNPSACSEGLLDVPERQMAVLYCVLKDLLNCCGLISLQSKLQFAHKTPPNGAVGGGGVPLGGRSALSCSVQVKTNLKLHDEDL